jgi:hypothetical protein
MDNHFVTSGQRELNIQILLYIFKLNIVLSVISKENLNLSDNILHFLHIRVLELLLLLFILHRYDLFFMKYPTFFHDFKYIFLFPRFWCLLVKLWMVDILSDTRRAISNIRLQINQYLLSLLPHNTILT